MSGRKISEIWLLERDRAIRWSQAKAKTMILSEQHIASAGRARSRVDSAISHLIPHSAGQMTWRRRESAPRLLLI
jgi:hypothetical protein